jgi:hypothetical protein
MGSKHVSHVKGPLVLRFSREADKTRGVPVTATTADDQDREHGLEHNSEHWFRGTMGIELCTRVRDRSVYHRINQVGWEGVIYCSVMRKKKEEISSNKRLGDEQR